MATPSNIRFSEAGSPPPNPPIENVSVKRKIVRASGNKSLFVAPTMVPPEPVADRSVKKDSIFNNVTSTTSLKVPIVADLAEVAPSIGDIVYDSASGDFQGYTATGWQPVSGGGGSGTASSLFYNASAGIIDVNVPGPTPTNGSVLMALSATSARWAQIATTGSISTIYVKPQSFGDPNPPSVPATQTLDSSSEFFSVAAALAYIGGLAAAPDYNNRYVIYIYPGLYTETVQLVVPSFVYLVGQCMETVRIQPLLPPGNGGFGYDFMTFAENSGASFLTIQNVDPAPTVLPGSAHNAILVENCGDFVLFHKIEIENCQQGILCQTDATGPTDGSYVYLEYVDTNFGANTYSLKCTTNGQIVAPLTVSAESYFTYQYSQDAFLVDGPRCELIMSGCSAQNGNLSGNAVTVINSGIVNARSVYIESFGTAFNVPTGGSPNLVLEGIIMEGCDQELQIPNVLCDGHFTGYTNYLKTFINPNNPFFITNQDTRVVTVARQGGNFSSVSDALAAITSSSINRYVIFVGPGTFNEPSLNFTGKQGISVIGYAQSSTTLKYTGLGTFIIADGDTIFQNLTIQVVPTSVNTAVAVNYQGSATPSQTLKIYGCVFKGSDTISVNSLNTVIECNSTNGPCFVLLENCIFNPGMYFTNGFTFNDTVGSSVNYSISGLLWGRQNLGAFNSFLNANGTGAGVFGSIVNVLAGANVLPRNGIGLFIQGNTTTVVQNTVLSGFTTGLSITGGGTRNITMTGTVVKDSTQAVNVDSGTTTGTINIVAQRGLVNIDPSATVSIQIDDPVDSSLTIVGDIYQGTEFADVTNVSTQIQRAATLGAIGQIQMTTPGGLNVTVPGGAGYVMIGVSSNILHYVQWSTVTLTTGPIGTGIPADSLTWVYVDSNGTVRTTGSEPNGITAINIGAVKTDSTSVVYFQQISHNLNNLASNIDMTLQNIGPIVGSGLATSSTGTGSNRDVYVSTGTYSFGSELFTFTNPAAPISMIMYYNGGANVGPGSTYIPLEYNPGNVGGLVNFTAAQWTKHTLYIVADGSPSTPGDPVFLFVYGQDLYNSQILAEGAPLPLVPNFFAANVCPIASFVINGTGATLVIGDIRPVLGFQSNGSLTTADHNSLLNLTMGNAHPQYLLVSGATPMDGNLIMGTNNIIITSPGNINGIDIEQHGFRHNPGGPDPIAVGISGQIETISSSASSPGGALNSVALTDHVHFHGNLSSVDSLGTELHSLADGTNPGFLSSAGFTLLSGATANATPNTLVRRDAGANANVVSLGLVSGPNVLSIAAPGLTGNITLNLPVTTGAAGWFLSTDGAGQSSWTNVLTSPVINGTFSGTTIVPIANGGTNTSTALNNNRIMVSNGGAIVESAALTTNQVLLGTVGAPEVTTLVGGGGIVLTNGPGTLTINTRSIALTSPVSSPVNTVGFLSILSYPITTADIVQGSTYLIQAYFTQTGGSTANITGAIRAGGVAGPIIVTSPTIASGTGQTPAVFRGMVTIRTTSPLAAFGSLEYTKTAVTTPNIAVSTGPINLPALPTTIDIVFQRINAVAATSFTFVNASIEKII